MLRDLIHYHPDAPWIAPVQAAPTKSPIDTYAPMAMSVPVAAPSLAPVAAAAAHVPVATPQLKSVMKSLHPIPSRVSRELEHSGYVEMPRRRVSRPVQYSTHRGITPIAIVYYR